MSKDRNDNEIKYLGKVGKVTPEKKFILEVPSETKEDLKEFAYKFLNLIGLTCLNEKWEEKVSRLMKLNDPNDEGDNEKRQDEKSSIELPFMKDVKELSIFDIYRSYHEDENDASSGITEFHIEQLMVAKENHPDLEWIDIFIDTYKIEFIGKPINHIVKNMKKISSGPIQVGTPPETYYYENPNDFARKIGIIKDYVSFDESTQDSPIWNYQIDEKLVSKTKSFESLLEYYKKDPQGRYFVKILTDKVYFLDLSVLNVLVGKR